MGGREPVGPWRDVSSRQPLVVCNLAQGEGFVVGGTGSMPGMPASAGGVVWQSWARDRDGSVVSLWCWRQVAPRTMCDVRRRSSAHSSPAALVRGVIYPSVSSFACGRRMTGGSGRGRTGWSGRRMTKGRGLGIPQEGGWHLGVTQGGFPVLGVGQSIDLVFTTFVRLKGHNAASACRVFTKIPANPQRSPSKPHGRGCIVPPRGQCWSRQIRDTRSSE